MFLGKYPGAGLALSHVRFFLLRPAMGSRAALLPIAGLKRKKSTWESAKPAPGYFPRNATPYKSPDLDLSQHIGMVLGLGPSPDQAVMFWWGILRVLECNLDFAGAHSSKSKCPPRGLRPRAPGSLTARRPQRAPHTKSDLCGVVLALGNTHMLLLVWHTS